jgi:sigma-B regulation protein RsbU (phosphoserine phosphatase)
MNLEVSVNPPPKLLIADDQTDVLEALRLLLKNEGFTFDLVTSPAAVLEKLQSADYDLLLMDLNYARDTTSGQEGLDLLGHVKTIDESLPVVVMTAWGSIPLAVETMQHGVGDFVQKPWDNARLLETLRTQVEHGRTRRLQIRSLRTQERELQEAREIQQNLIPRDLPNLPGYCLSARWQPAHTIGGDSYDVLAFDSRRFALCIADVAGKGMPAALLMSNLQAAVKAIASPQLAPRDLCSRLNNLLIENVSNDRFITFFYGLVDGKNRRLSYVNAGHNPPLLFRKGGEVIRLNCGGTVLGIWAESEYQQEEIELKPGDRLLLYTDGVVEARSSQSEEFGEDRLFELLREHASMRVEDLTAKIMLVLSQYCRDEWSDDATLLAMDVL